MQEVPFRMFQNFRGVQMTMSAMVSQKYENFKQSYHVKRLSDELDARYKDFAGMYKKLLEDEAEFENPEEQDQAKKTISNKEHVDAKVEELMDTTLKLKWAPVPLPIIEQMNPTPEQFTVLEFLFDSGEIDAEAE